MLRNVALACIIAAGILGLKGASAVLWPLVQRRMDRSESTYSALLKDLFRPIAAAKNVTRAQYFGSVGVVAVIWLVTGNLIISAAIGVASFFLPRFIFARLRAKRLTKFNHQLPDALRVMADAAKAGLSLPRMVQMVAEQGPKPLAEEFGLVVHAMDLGDSVDEALKRTGKRLNLPNFDLMTMALLVNRERGGDIAQLFVRLAEAIRALSDAEEKIETETASVRLSAKIMLGTIPVFALALFLVDPTSMSMLFSTSAGALVLVVVAILAATGYRMIQRLASPEI